MTITAVMLPFRHVLSLYDVSFIFLVIVVMIALLADRWTSASTAVFAFLLLNFFFILPYHTFNIAVLRHALALFVFLGVAMLTSQLVYLLRLRAVEALQRSAQMEALFHLSRTLIDAATLDDILASMTRQVPLTLRFESCSVLMPAEDGQLLLRAGSGAQPEFMTRDEAAIAAWVFQTGEIGGLGQQRGRLHQRWRSPEREATTIYVPIGTSDHMLGVIRARVANGQRRVSPEDERALSMFANHAAIAMERVRLTEETTQIEVLERSDALKSALLAAVSHELRTPLATIKASVTSLLQTEFEWSAEDRRVLLETIDGASDRLNRIIENLLDLSRIEAGVLVPRMDWNDIEELIRDVVQRSANVAGDHPLHVELPPDLPPLRFDYVEVSQVLVNLIENAAKYAPSGTAIDVIARRAGGMVEVSVADRGPGIAIGDEERVFDRFYRGRVRPGYPGVGIGLSICRGLIQAHGGRIWVENRDGGGATFRFTLPIDVHHPRVRLEELAQ